MTGRGAGPDPPARAGAAAARRVRPLPVPTGTGRRGPSGGTGAGERSRGAARARPWRSGPRRGSRARRKEESPEHLPVIEGLQLTPHPTCKRRIQRAARNGFPSPGTVRMDASGGGLRSRGGDPQPSPGASPRPPSYGTTAAGDENARSYKPGPGAFLKRPPERGNQPELWLPFAPSVRKTFSHRA